MFLVQSKSAALIVALACAAVLAQPGRAAAQSDRPPGLKGYALVQWMDEHRSRSSPSVRGPQSWTYAAPRAYAYPQSFAYVQPHYGYVPSHTFAPPAARTVVRGAPVLSSPCGGR
jgi:hypothetical protein